MPRKGKYEQWLKPENLRKITNWAANGLTDKQLSQNMGIHYSTLYDWIARFPELPEAIKEGREMRDLEVENALYRCAVGKIEEITEVIEEHKALVDGELVTVSQHIRRTTKKLPPQYAAAIFLAKNHMGYEDNPEVNVNIEAAPAFYFSREDVEKEQT